MAYRFIEHTADVAVEIDAATLPELFAQALAGLTATLTDLETVGSDRTRDLALGATRLDLLLVDWLSELLYVFETEELVWRAAEVEIDGDDAGWRLRAVTRGERFDPRRHPQRIAVKGVTYHALAVERRGERWRARVVFDV